LIAEKRSDGLTLLGMAYFRLGESAKATDALTQSLEFAPEDAPAINTLNRIYGAAGNTAQADIYREKLRAINNKTKAEEKRLTRLVPLYYQLEDAYEAKDLGKVVDLAKQIEPMADKQTKLTVYQYLVAAYRGLGREAEAQQVIAKATKLSQE
jgi:tetratricopeptide (TPR) repeat protein